MSHAKMALAALGLACLAAFSPALAAAPETAPARDQVAQAFTDAVRELEADAASPRALVPLARLHRLEDELPDLAQLAIVYANVAGDERAHPEARALARHALMRVERSRGQLQRAFGQLAGLGFVERWTVIGPFDDEGKVGFEAVYPPEKAIDLAARHHGKAREVAWRELPPEAVAWGFVHLGAALRPAREVTAYALAVVDSPREQRVHLHLGASGASKVFVNGQPAVEDRRYHPARLDQASVAVTLAQGPNRILVKLCHQDGRLGFYLRLTTPDGQALRPRILPADTALAAKAVRARPERLPAAVEALEKRAASARGEDGASARMDLALALGEKGATDERERRPAEEARKAAQLAPRWVEAQLEAARQEREDLDRRRGHLEAALAADPRNPRALLGLGELELRRGRPHAAAPLFARAAEAAPEWAAARLALAAAYDEAGLAARAHRERTEAERRFALVPAAVRAAAREAQRLGRVDDAARLYRKALALRYDDDEARASLSQLLVERGDLDGALEQMDVALRLDPTDNALRLRKADLLAANGRSADAERAFAAAERLAPEDAEVHERRGEARLRAGVPDQAIADFQRALELRPQNPRLKERLRALEPERERFEQPYALDARALAASFEKRRGSPPANEDAVVLGRLKVTRVFPSGLSATYTHVVVKVLNRRGVDAWRSHSVGYVPDRQEVRVERARVVKPDGAAVDSHQESERSSSEPWYRLYYDNRTRVLTFPALAPGDVLEVAYRTEDVAAENLLSDYFGDLTFVDEPYRKLLFDYVLLVPKGREIHANRPELPGVEATVRELAGGTVERRWRVRDVPAFEPEPGMPGSAEVSRYVHVSTYRDWSEVARFYWGLVKEQLAPTEEVREVAHRIAAEVRARKAPGEDEGLLLVRAVHDFVVTNTRYVGLEFGIHGFKPYRVDQVLSRRFGDCKDKASLTHALLEVLGIDSRLVLLRMKRLGRVPEYPASLAVFNHAILHVPRYDLWLDGTASYSGSRELPGEDRGAAVLVVNPGEAPRFGYVPDAAAEENLTETRYTVALSADGSARVEADSRVGGVAATGYRRAYQAEGERRAALEQAYAKRFPGLSVETVALSDLSLLEQEVSMRFALAVPRFAQAEGQGLSFPAYGSGHAWLESHAPLSSRRHDLVVGDPFETRFTHRYKLPQGYEVRELPPPVALEGPFGAFAASCRVEGGELVSEARVVFRVGRVAARDYGAFRHFVAEVDHALSRRVRAAPAAVPAASGGAPGAPREDRL